MQFRPVITFGTIVVLVGMIGSAATLVYQIGSLRASLEAGIKAEHDLREIETRVLHDDIAIVRSDVRDLRTIILNTRADRPAAVKPN